MKILTNLISPFKVLNRKQRVMSSIALFFLFFFAWEVFGSPGPSEVLGAIPKLVFKDNLMFHFQKSVFFCLKTMAYSVIISLVICYLSVLPLFASFCEVLRKFRFLPSAGLSFFFMKITPTIDSTMTALMVYGITTWLVDSMLAISLSIKPEEVMYARSLRLSRWQSMREILIYGKAAQLFNAVIANFAMAWMLLAAVENIVKASGGIGVILSESNKYFKFEQVYAILLLILLTGTLIDYLLRLLRDFLFPYYNIKH